MERRDPRQNAAGNEAFIVGLPGGMILAQTAHERCGGIAGRALITVDIGLFVYGFFCAGISCVSKEAV
jgi:hypothetical protein